MTASLIMLGVEKVNSRYRKDCKQLNVTQVLEKRIENFVHELLMERQIPNDQKLGLLDKIVKSKFDDFILKYLKQYVYSLKYFYRLLKLQQMP